jgi:WD40 repeat protein
VSFNPTGTAILSTGKDDWLKITDIKSGKVLKSLAGAGQNFYSGKYLPSGEGFIVGTLGKGAQIRLGAKFIVMMGHSDYSVFDVDYHGPSGRVLTAGRDGNAIVWNGKDGKRIQTLKGHGDWVVHASFLPSGKFGATASSDRTVRVWDMKTFLPVATLEGQTAVGSPICATADGKFLVTVNLDDFMQVYALKPAQPGPSTRRR